MIYLENELMMRNVFTVSNTVLLHELLDKNRGVLVVRTQNKMNPTNERTKHISGFIVFRSNA